MHCFSSRLTSWLTRTLRGGGCVLRRCNGASVIRPSHLGWPTQQQRRAQEAIAVVWSQPIPRCTARGFLDKILLCGCPYWGECGEPFAPGLRRAAVGILLQQP